MLEYLEIIESVTILLFSIVIHENAHARMAYFLGDPTSKNAGRFSLNPLKHLDLVGVLLPFILLYMKLPPLSFAKPVMVFPQNFKYPTLYNIIVALAGPLSNLLLAFLAVILYSRLGFLHYDIVSSIEQFLVIVIRINLLLFIFNMLPIPPLDGSRIYTSFIDRIAPSSISQTLELLGFAVIVFLLNNDEFQEYFQSLFQHTIRVIVYFVG